MGVQGLSRSKTAFKGPLCPESSAKHRLYDVLLLQWRGKKEEGVVFFPFLENKEDKKNSEQAWTFLIFFFTLTAPNSACL